MRASDFTTKNDIKPIITKFIKFTAEYLELPSLPTFQLSNKEFAAKNSTFGQYGNHHITVVTQNRHINDILRTLAHEMVHYHQDINDKINMNSSKNIMYIEAEANAVAGLILRKWNKQYPELMIMQPINESIDRNWDTIKLDGGYITIWPNAPYAPRPNSVIDFQVDKDKQNQGIGSQLIKLALQKYDNIGAQVSSKPSLKAFYNNGFRNPKIPNGTFNDHLDAWEENGHSLFMANKQENISESKYQGKTKAYHIGGYTGTKVPDFLKNHIKKSKNGNLYYNQYQDSWYANTFQGEYGIYDFHTFQKAINPYFRVQRVYQPN